MGSLTTAKAVPYPVGTDPADPRFIYDMASWADTAFAAYDVAFSASPAAFLIRNLNDSIAIPGGGSTTILNNGSVSVDWNTTGGTVDANGRWTQSASDNLSWWMLGCNFATFTASGTGVLGTRVQAAAVISGFDQVTGLPLLNAMGDGGAAYNNGFTYNSITYTMDATETNSGGEWLAFYAIVSLYKSTVAFIFENFDTGASTKKALSGSVTWGIKLGDV